MIGKKFWHHSYPARQTWPILCIKLAEPCAKATEARHSSFSMCGIGSGKARRVRTLVDPFKQGKPWWIHSNSAKAWWNHSNSANPGGSIQTVQTLVDPLKQCKT